MGYNHHVETDRMNIYTLTMMVRRFSNEVTVNWLASRLGVSYSTLARCKSGVWPRSITFNAMKGVFAECLSRFFDGDEAKLADSALGYLERQGIDAAPFAERLASGGFNAFVTSLISAARDGGFPGGPQEAKVPEGAAFAVAAGGTQRELAKRALAHDPSRREAIIALPVAAILAFGLLNVPLADLLIGAYGHLAITSLVLLGIAALPVALGLAIDMPIAWRAFRKDHPDAEPAWENRKLVARYGSTRETVAGAGRFDASWRHCSYQLLCNVFGALCCLSLLVYLMRLPGFGDFLAAHEWAEFFKVGIAVGFFIAYSHARENQVSRGPVRMGDGRENPDNHLPDRAHVWANTVHLVCTFSLVCILVLGLLAYSFARFRMHEPDPLIIWPFLQTVVFLAYSSVSGEARRTEALGVGAFLPGVAASSVGVSALTLACFLPSWKSAAIVAVCAACLAAAIAWYRAHRSGELSSWLANGRKSGAYSIAVLGSALIMLAIGSITSLLP